MLGRGEMVHYQGKVKFRFGYLPRFAANPSGSKYFTIDVLKNNQIVQAKTEIAFEPHEVIMLADFFLKKRREYRLEGNMNMVKIVTQDITAYLTALLTLRSDLAGLCHYYLSCFSEPPEKVNQMKLALQSPLNFPKEFINAYDELIANENLRMLRAFSSIKTMKDNILRQLVLLDNCMQLETKLLITESVTKRIEILNQLINSLPVRDSYHYQILRHYYSEIPLEELNDDLTLLAREMKCVGNPPQQILEQLNFIQIMLKFYDIFQYLADHRSEDSDKAIRRNDFIKLLFFCKYAWVSSVEDLKIFLDHSDEQCGFNAGIISNRYFMLRKKLYEFLEQADRFTLLSGAANVFVLMMQHASQTKPDSFSRFIFDKNDGLIRRLALDNERLVGFATHLAEFYPTLKVIKPRQAEFELKRTESFAGKMFDKLRRAISSRSDEVEKELRSDKYWEKKL